jgi:hypothetical protein
MCEDSARPVKLLILTSLTELAHGKKCCSVNNGKPHVHRIKAENQRHEKVHVRGNVTTRSGLGQLAFAKGASSGQQWSVDFLAYGQKITSEAANILVQTVQKSAEDIEANLEYKYDDPWSNAYSSLTLTVGVQL